MLKQIMIALTGAAAIGVGFAGGAQAGSMSLTPQQQGEINVGLGCLSGTCLQLDTIFSSVESLVDTTSGTQSRLFVDYFGEGDSNVTYGSGRGRVKLKTRDAGTNAMGYWFRPSERKPNGGNEERGQLEVGTYTFNFTEILSELTIDFFDTESSDTTGVIAINGVDLSSPDFVPEGDDGNIISQTFTDVGSITLKLGNDTRPGTGDGVDFRLSKSVAVPEPASLLGLAAIGAVAAGGALKKKAAA